MNEENSVLVSKCGITVFRRLLPKCFVCLEYIREGECKLEKCNHRFHHQCLVQWISKSSTCPVCRVECCSIKLKDGSAEVVIGDENTLLMELSRDEEIEPPPFCNLCDQQIFYNEETGRVITCLTASAEHEFHMDCLAEHFLNNGTFCPMCGPEKHCNCVELSGGEQLHYDARKRDFFFIYTSNEGVVELIYIHDD